MRFAVWMGWDKVVVEAENPSHAKRRVRAAFPDREVGCASLVQDGWTPRAAWTAVGACLVWLSEPMLGSNIHTARINPNLTVIGSVFEHDCPGKILFCRPLPAPPQMVTLELPE
ncbi:MAG: hypothetical protein WC718_15825 [Phycisphaerales bacterium]|jgi:hypothetical protein